MYPFCEIVGQFNIIRYKCFHVFLLFLIFINSSNISAQNDSTDIYELDFSQLSKIKITSATKISQNITEIPSTVYVIPASEIQEKGYFTLDDVLSDLPGFQFRNIQGINSYIFQRGIHNQNNLTLILIDGVQVNELNSGGFYGGGQYNLSNVERIEVVYGPSSVVYGTNAVSGIINIITKSVFDKQSKARLCLGAFNTLLADVNYSYSNEKKDFGVLLSGMFKKTDKTDMKGIAGDNNWTDKMDNFENDYTFDLKIQYNDFTFGTNYLYKQSSTSTWMKSVGTIYKDYGTSWNIQFVNNYLKYNKLISKNLTFSSVLYNRNTTVLDNTIYFVVDTAQIGYYRPNNLTGFENILNYKISTFFSLTGGLTFEYERLAKKNTYSISDSPTHIPPKPPNPDMIDNKLISIFVEPSLSLLSNLFLSGGVRYDNSSVYNQVLTPRTGLSYIFYDNILRLSYAEAFRAPKPWDYTDGLGNNALLPERMKSFEISVSFLMIKNIKLDLTAYKNNLQNALVKEINESGYRWVNTGKVNTDGVELSFKYNYQNFKSSINYTFNQSYNEYNIFIPEISKHTGNLSASYSFAKNFSLNIRANYVGKRENPQFIVNSNSKFIEPYLIFNGCISYLNYKGFDFQININNIFDVEYYHTSNRDPQRYRQPQRSLFFSVTYSLL